MQYYSSCDRYKSQSNAQRILKFICCIDLIHDRPYASIVYNTIH